MITSTNAGLGYGGLSPEEMQALIRRAHEERTQALRDAVARLLSRHQRPAAAGNTAPPKAA